MTINSVVFLLQNYYLQTSSSGPRGVNFTIMTPLERWSPCISVAIYWYQHSWLIVRPDWTLWVTIKNIQSLLSLCCSPYYLLTSHLLPRPTLGWNVSLQQTTYTSYTQESPGWIAPRGETHNSAFNSQIMSLCLPPLAFLSAFSKYLDVFFFISTSIIVKYHVVQSKETELWVVR